MGLVLSQKLANQLNSKIEHSGNTFYLDLILEIENSGTYHSLPSSRGLQEIQRKKEKSFRVSRNLFQHEVLHSSYSAKIELPPLIEETKGSLHQVKHILAVDDTPMNLLVLDQMLR